MAIFNILLQAGNRFLFAFIVLKVYQWFGPEVGFALPTLTYLNVLAIQFILGAFNTNIGLYINIIKIYEEETGKKFSSIERTLFSTLAYLIFWGIMFLYYSVLF